MAFGLAVGLAVGLAAQDTLANLFGAVAIFLDKPFKIGDAEIIPIEVIHGKLPIFGYRIKNFAYITDASFIPEEEEHKLKDLDVLVLNALRIRPHPTHFNLEQATELALKYGAKKTYFTHITHEMFHDEVNESLPPNIGLGYDSLTFELD